MAITLPYPFALPDADRPFAADTEHLTYDPAAVTRYWQVLSRINLLLEEFAGRFSGKTSPVHHFWHTFDIAVSRFAARRIDQPPTVDRVTREASAACPTRTPRCWTSTRPPTRRGPVAPVGIWRATPAQAVSPTPTGRHSTGSRWI